MCDEFVLDNGVRVIAEYIPHFPSVSVVTLKRFSLLVSVSFPYRG